MCVCNYSWFFKFFPFSKQSHVLVSLHVVDFWPPSRGLPTGRATGNTDDKWLHTIQASASPQRGQAVQHFRFRNMRNQKVLGAPSNSIK